MPLAPPLLSITTLVLGGIALIGSTKLGLDSMDKFMKEAKSKPGKIQWGSTENTTRMTGELFRVKSGLQIDNVLIQLSGTMGSRQEEAQRLGRVLRPKPGGASFYTMVTRDTIEQDHALHRQLFLTEQGYRYYIDEVAEGDLEVGQSSALH